MKRKPLSFIGLVTVGLCLASCNYIDILAHKLKSIVISDSTSAYVVGDSFFNKCNLSMLGTYTNGDKVTLTKSDVTFRLTLSGQEKNIDSPFTSEGSYKLTVSKDSIKSNELTITVFASTQYVSNIQVSGQSTIEENSQKEVPLSLTITPSKFTVPVSYTVSDTSIVSLSKVNDTSYRMKGLAIGEAVITFRALKNETQYFEAEFGVTVTESKKVAIKQTYSNFVEHNYYNTSSCPTIGSNVKLLVIPVWFKDSTTFLPTDNQNNIRDDIQTAFFGTNEQTGWRSVKTFYEEESKGLLTLNGTVSEWYQTNVTSSQASNFTNSNQAEFVKTATEWYFNNHEDSRSNYDYDHDGYLDGVMLIYAAPDYQVYSSFTSNMWAYCFYVQQPGLRNPDNPGVNGFFWASYDFLYGSNRAYSRTGGGYCNGDTSHCYIDAHTYIHEMGHMFGLEDYYDYSKVSSPTAGFSMQDNNVGGHDPFSTMAFGWSDPYIPTGSCEITINDFQSSHDIILLTPSWNSNDSPFDEYLLLELYSPTGLNKFDSDYQYSVNYPRGPQTVGIRLWHVDARLFTVTGRFSTNADSGVKFFTAFTNTYRTTTEDKNGRNAFSYDVSSNINYQRLNLLHLIRKNKSGQSYTSLADLTSNDLFVKDSTFDMESYSPQFFKNDSLLNSGLSLGWSFTVKSITSGVGNTYSATVQLTKA